MPASVTRPIISAASVGVAFEEVDVLREVSFKLEQGTFVSLLGPSGCGKSTLLRVIAGLLRPTRGSVTIDGIAPREARRGRHRIGIVFQDPVLIPWRNVAQNIRLPAEFKKQQRDADIDRLLKLVGLDPTDRHKRPSELSGGMRMRVSLARALVTEPTLFLLDEPFAALDDVLRQQLNDELLRIHQQQKCTTVFVTHNVAEAVYLSDRVLVLSSGPAQLAANIPIPFDADRTRELRGTPDFAKLVQDVSEQLREAAQ